MTGVIVEVRVENLVLDVDLVTTIVDIAVKNIRKVDRVLGQVVLDRHYNSLGVLIVDIENVWILVSVRVVDTYAEMAEKRHEVDIILHTHSRKDFWVQAYRVVGKGTLVVDRANDIVHNSSDYHIVVVKRVEVSTLSNNWERVWRRVRPVPVRVHERKNGHWGKLDFEVSRYL